MQDVILPTGVPTSALPDQSPSGRAGRILSVVKIQKRGVMTKSWQCLHSVDNVVSDSSIDADAGYHNSAASDGIRASPCNESAPSCEHPPCDTSASETSGSLSRSSQLLLMPSRVSTPIRVKKIIRISSKNKHK